MIGLIRLFGLTFFLIGFSLLVIAKQSNHNEQLLRVKQQYMKVLSKVTKDAALVLEEKLTALEKDLKKATAPSRRKRSYTQSPDLVLLKSLEVISTLPSPSELTDVAFVQTSKYAYMIGAASRDSRRPEKALCPIWIWNAELSEFQILATVPVMSAIGVEAFAINDEPYFTFALNTKKDLKDIVVRNSKIYKILDNGKIITTQVNPTVAATQWKSFYVDGQIFLASGSYLELRPPRDSKDYAHSIPKASSNITIYKWTGHAFTRFQTIPASHTTKLEFISIHNRHFLAVVNQTFLENYAESTILIYEIVPHFKGEKKLTLFQRIKGWAVGDIKFIKTRRELYLAIAYEFRVHNRVKLYELHSMIYRFNGLFFVQYQHIPTSCAMRWTIIYGAAGELALHLLSRDKEHMFALIEGSWVEVPLPFSFGASTLKGFRFLPDGQSYLAIGRAKELQIAVPKFIHRQTEEKSKEILALCNGLKDRLRNLGEQRSRLEKSELQVASRNGSQTLYGRKTFINVRIRTLNINKVHIRKTQMFKSLIMKKIDDLKQIVETLPQNLSSYLSLSKPQSLENGNLVMGDAKLDRASAPMAYLRNVNGRGPLCDLIDKAFWFRPEGTVIKTNNWLIFERVIFADSLNVSGLVNGLRFPDHVAFLDRHNYFSAPKNFESEMEIKNELQLIGSVNGIKPSNLLLTVGDQTIGGNLVFGSDVDVKRVNLKIQDGRVNGVPWSWFKNEVVLTDRKEVLKGAKVFKQDIVIQGDFAPERSVGEVNIQRMCKASIPLVGSQRFHQNVIFRDIKLSQDLNVNGPINNIQFPQHLLSFRDPVWNVQLNFTNTTKVQKLEVEGLVNGFKIEEDLLTKSRPQLITDTKTFNNLEVHVDLEITGLLNGQNLTQIIQRFKPKVLPTRNHYDSLKVREMKISRIADPNLQKILGDAVRLNEPHTFPGIVDFKTTSTFQNNLVASQSIFNELVPAVSPQQLTLPGSTFGDLMFLRGFFVDKTINGISLKPLAHNILLTVGEQVITTPKTFLSDINVEHHLLVNGPINGVNLNDLAKINEDTTIAAKLIFTVPPVLESTTILHNLRIKDALNGMSVSQWLDDTLLTDSNQKIFGEKTFLNGLTIGNGAGKHNVLVKGNVYLGDVDLFQLLDDLVLANRSEIIDAPTTFASMASISKLTADSVNGVNIEDLFTSALRKKDDRCIMFMTSVGIEHINTPQINNISIDDLFTKVMLIDDEILPGTLHFSNVISQGDIKMEGLINGKPFGEDMVRKSSQSNTIVAPKEFLAPLSTSNVQLNGLVNNIDIKALDQALVKQGVPQQINGKLEAGNIVINGNLFVEGPIQGIFLEAFYKRAMRTDKPSLLSHYKTFEKVIHNPISARNFEIHGMIDNINLTYLHEKAVTLHTEQDLGQLTFLNTVFFNNVTVRDLQILDGSYLNNINVDAWAVAIMKRTGKQTLKHPNTFEVVKLSGIELQGAINNIPPKDFLYLTGGKVENAKIFEKVVADYLRVGGLLMSQNLTKFVEDAVTLDKPKPEIIMAPKTFLNVEVKNDVEFKTYIDGIKTSSVMTTRGNQEVAGGKTFTNSVGSARWMDVNLQGTINNSPLPMKEIIQILLTQPLAYPCMKDFIYYQGSCFLLIPYIEKLNGKPHEVCRKRNSTPVKNIPTRFYEELGLAFEENEWFIKNSNFKVLGCITPANLDVEIPLMLNGKFTFENVTRGTNNTQITSTAEKKFDLSAKMYNWQKTGINQKLDSVTQNLGRVCHSSEKVKYALTYAYRPFGDFMFVQQLNQNYLKIYSLPPQMTDSRMAFLALQLNMLDFYINLGNNFVLSASVPVSPVENLETLDHDNFIDSNGNLIIILPSSTDCQRGNIGHLYIWKIRITAGPSPSISVAEIEDFAVDCLSPSVLDILQTQQKTVLLKPDKEDINMYQWNEELEKFDFFLSIPGTFSLQHIKGVGKRGHVLVIRSDNGNSHLEIMKINLESATGNPILKTYESQYIDKVLTFTVASDLYIIFVENSRIRLMKLEKRQLITIQVLKSSSCVTDLIFAPSKGFIYLVVSTVSTTDYYTFKGYLQYYKGLNLPTEKVAILNTQNEIFHIAKVKYLSETKITIFRSVQKGPQGNIKCGSKC